jgi:hypothetical protein
MQKAREWHELMQMQVTEKRKRGARVAETRAEADADFWFRV